MRYYPSPKYRRDIDGLRAVAVIAVIFFHFGCLPNGYLGVDVFFVISGFLITGIIYRERSEGRFSIADFYLRRTRRIVPLVSFICAIALLIGWFTMLPDDLENLAQSVIATNAFSNNVLQALTTKNYWDVVNEYKPLMHTWSLGIEEQYYLLYPLLFLMLPAKWLRWSGRLLVLLAIGSFALWVHQPQGYRSFYLLPYRFYELAMGGVLAIHLDRRWIRHPLGPVPLIALVLLLVCPLPAQLAGCTLPLAVLLSCLALATAHGESRLASWALENQLAVGIGKISFSVYMWHQVLLAYARYACVPELRPAHLTLVFALTILLSLFSYYAIEQPFRDKTRVKTRALLITCIGTTLLTTGVSWMIYVNAGVVRDVPELGLKRGQATRGMHASFNQGAAQCDRDFVDDSRCRILVLGDSFARDWVNVLLASSHRQRFQVSYIEHPRRHASLAKRAAEADVIFFSRADREDAITLGLDLSRVWCVGTKNFGHSSGTFYNYRGADYCQQRTPMEHGYAAENRRLAREFPDRYIDLIALVIDSAQTVPVFTPDCRLISQDCRHLTTFGAAYFAGLLDERLDQLIRGAERSKTTREEGR